MRGRLMVGQQPLELPILGSTPSPAALGFEHYNDALCPNEITSSIDDILITPIRASSTPAKY